MIGKNAKFYTESAILFAIKQELIKDPEFESKVLDIISNALKNANYVTSYSQETNIRKVFSTRPEIADSFRKRRIALDLTLKEVANATGINSSMLSYIELPRRRNGRSGMGGNRPSANVVNVLSNFYTEQESKINPIIESNIGNQFRKRRRELNLSIKKVADKLNVSTTKIFNLETNRIVHNQNNFKKLVTDLYDSYSN